MSYVSDVFEKSVELRKRDAKVQNLSNMKHNGNEHITKCELVFYTQAVTI